VTGEGTLENIPKLSNAESTTRGAEPLYGISPVKLHILSATIALSELAGSDVVRDTPEAAVAVVYASGWPDWVTLYHDAASDHKLCGLPASTTTLYVPEGGFNR
jgi:hypothetical protein